MNLLPQTVRTDLRAKIDELECVAGQVRVDIQAIEHRCAELQRSVNEHGNRLSAVEESLQALREACASLSGLAR